MSQGEGSSIFGRLQWTPLVVSSKSVQQSHSVSSQAGAQAVSSSWNQCCRSGYIQTRDSLISCLGDITFIYFSWTLKRICSCFIIWHYTIGLHLCEQKQRVNLNQVPSGIKWGLKVSKCEPNTLELWMNQSCQRQLRASGTVIARNMQVVLWHLLKKQVTLH